MEKKLKFLFYNAVKNSQSFYTFACVFVFCFSLACWHVRQSVFELLVANLQSLTIAEGDPSPNPFIHVWVGSLVFRHSCVRIIEEGNGCLGGDIILRVRCVGQSNTEVQTASVDEEQKSQWSPSQSRKESILNCLLMGNRGFIYKSKGGVGSEGSDQEKTDLLEEGT